MTRTATLLLALLGSAAVAQTPAAYHRAPPAIQAMLDAPVTPGVLLSPDRRTMAIVGRENLPGIASVSRPILRLGGYRIDPATNGPAEVRVQWLNALAFQDIATGRQVKVALPAGTRFTYARWSPDGSRVAMVVQGPDGLSLWAATRDGRAAAVLGGVNAAWGGQPYEWLPDSSGLLVRTVDRARGPAPVAATTPAGPVVQESTARQSAARTYQDLLTDAHDEALFDHYFTGALVRVGADGGGATVVKAPDVWRAFSVSPDGRYLLTERLKRPYSYLLPAAFFPTEIAVSTMDGKPVRTLVDRPLADDLPVDFDAAVKGPRDVEWRSDAPATLTWAEALDGGNPKAQVAHHDKVMMQAAPFTAAPAELARTLARYRGTTWGNDDFAMVSDAEWRTRTEHRYAVAPARPAAARLLLTRNYQDQYADPGTPVTQDNAAGHPVMQFTPDRAAVFVTGEGASKAGAFPFLGRMALPTAPPPGCGRRARPSTKASWRWRTRPARAS